jgi:hypothetical protein
MKLLDLTGKKFGRFTVIKRTATEKKHWRWLCRCDCGTEKIVDAGHLKSSHSISCGCYKKERSTKHGHAGRETSEYMAWKHAKDRCFNPNDKAYKNYGARGITMCAEWRDSFAAFFADVGLRPSGLSLDRFPNNNGNYEPGNVRWATRSEQNRNQRPRARQKCALEVKA